MKYKVVDNELSNYQKITQALLAKGWFYLTRSDNLEIWAHN